MLAFAAKLAGSRMVLGTVILLVVAVTSHHLHYSFLDNRLRPMHSFFNVGARGPLASFSVATVGLRPREDQGNDEFDAIEPAIEELLRDQPDAQLGIAVRWSNGETLYMRNAGEPFPMASVAKVYMLVAYLDRLEREQRQPTGEEIELLSSMIDVSDNTSASEIWDALGSLSGMQRYLDGIGMALLAEPPIEGWDPEEGGDAWGDASQSASETSLFLARLWQRELLSRENTQLARSFLSDVVEEQAWGVTTDVEKLDPQATVLVKNGWYPAESGWRVNSAGIVVPGHGEPYVLVIFGQGFDSWDDGIETVNAVAALINELLLG